MDMSDPDECGALPQIPWADFSWARDDAPIRANAPENSVRTSRKAVLYDRPMGPRIRAVRSDTLVPPKGRADP